MASETCGSGFDVPGCRALAGDSDDRQLCFAIETPKTDGRTGSRVFLGLNARL